MEQLQQSNYKKIFRDVKNGFSEVNVLENLFYLKHMSFEDQVDIDQIYDYYFEEAKNLFDWELGKHGIYVQFEKNGYKYNHP